ncbi:MAG: hypothetical protein IT367_05435 [Candidatus Hydrogenedentes bacterium]|nr:hypothetical protein [Candidatus Hydrogenedentota bacterium]
MKRATNAALLLIFGLFLFALGYLARRNDWIPLSWREAVRPQAENTRANRPFQGDAFPLQDPSVVDPELKSTLAAMGYLQGTQPAGNRSGVTLNDAAITYEGLNLYTSGHAPEAILMDMNGATLHTWRCSLDDAIPGYENPPHVRDAARESWRRAYLYPDGSLLAIFEGMALIKVDKDSNVIWSYTAGCHHDMQVLPDGNIFVLTSEPCDGIIDNGIALINANGKELRRTSLLDCFRASPYAALLQSLPKHGDVLHVNTVNILDGAHADNFPAFAASNLLVSSLTLNTIAVVDFERATVPWAISGMTVAQHEPTLLANGNILVFDNRGAGKTSRVLEIRPPTHEVVWQHPAPGGIPFHSEWCGSVQRLPNGNTLITETDNGRAFEVTPDHKIVWEYINPNQFDEKGVRMVAALFDVVRLHTDYVKDWLAETPSSNK